MKHFLYGILCILIGKREKCHKKVIIAEHTFRFCQNRFGHLGYCKDYLGNKFK